MWFDFNTYIEYSIDLNQIELKCNKSSELKWKLIVWFHDKIRGCCGFCTRFTLYAVAVVVVWLLLLNAWNLGRFGITTSQLLYGTIYYTWSYCEWTLKRGRGRRRKEKNSTNSSERTNVPELCRMRSCKSANGKTYGMSVSKVKLKCIKQSNKIPI